MKQDLTLEIIALWVHSEIVQIVLGLSHKIWKKSDTQKLSRCSVLFQLGRKIEKNKKIGWNCTILPIFYDKFVL